MNLISHNYKWILNIIILFTYIIICKKKINFTSLPYICVVFVYFKFMIIIYYTGIDSIIDGDVLESTWWNSFFCYIWIL